MCQGKFSCLPRNWIYLRQNYFTSYVYLKDTYKTLERNWKNPICIKLNNSTKSVNFKISEESSQRNKLKLSKLEYYSLCAKVSFSVIHPTHIAIYSF